MEALTPLSGGSAIASRSLVRKHRDLVPTANAGLVGSWVPLLSTNMVAGTVPLTHQGSYRVWLRAYNGTATLPSFRFAWGVGGASAPTMTTNDAVQIPGGLNEYVLDLGGIRIDPPPVGPGRWQGAVQAQPAGPGDVIVLDCLWFQPLDDGAGKLAYVSTPPATSITAVKGPGAGADDASGGSTTWANPGNITAADSSMATAALNSSQSHYLKSSSHGFAINTSATIQGIQVDVLRRALVSPPTAPITDARMSLIKAGTFGLTNKANLVAQWPGSPAVASYGGPTDLWGTTWAASDINDSGFGAVLAATGGGVGQLAEVDYISITVYYTLSSGLSVAPDAVIAGNSTLELRTDGAFRQVGGTTYGPVSTVVGDLPRVPPSGLESRALDVIVKASDGNLADEPDPSIRPISAQLIYRPSYLYTP